jgi:uncharacterized membrane protein YdjX (TVP38/TMEM64 family)
MASSHSVSPPDPTPAAGKSGEQRPRSAREMLLFELSRPRSASRRTLLLALLAVLTVATAFVYTDLSWSGVIEGIQGLSPWALLPLMALLPIAGFSVSIVYLVAGARFGPVWGGVVVLAITFVHLVGTYAVARTFLREPLRRYVEKRQRRLPEVPLEDQPAVCVIAGLVPGLPYAIRNYLVVLAGVKLRYLFAICLPIHVARSYVIILLGDTAHDPARARVAILLGIDLLRATICGLVIWRLRVRQLARQRDQAQAAGP